MFQVSDTASVESREDKATNIFNRWLALAAFCFFSVLSLCAFVKLKSSKSVYLILVSLACIRMLRRTSMKDCRNGGIWTIQRILVCISVWPFYFYFFKYKDLDKTDNTYSVRSIPMFAHAMFSVKGEMSRWFKGSGLYDFPILKSVTASSSFVTYLIDFSSGEISHFSL